MDKPLTNINVEKLDKELRAAGIAISGCNDKGIVWNVDGLTEIQKRADVQAVLMAHNPIPEPESIYQEFQKPIKAPDFIVSMPNINNDPEKALDEAIAEMKKGEGSPKSVTLMVLSLTKYLEAKKAKLK